MTYGLLGLLHKLRCEKYTSTGTQVKVQVQVALKSHRDQYTGTHSSHKVYRIRTTGTAAQDTYNWNSSTAVREIENVKYSAIKI